MYQTVSIGQVLKNLRMVLGIDRHIFMGEVARPDGVLILPQPKFQSDIDIPAFHRGAERIEVALRWHAFGKDQDVVHVESGL